MVDAYRTSQRSRPSQKVVCGFSRRFDASYRDAFDKMQAGGFGRPSVFRSQTCDKLDPSGFFVEYAQFSGGIFVDCSIHDIDLALWFFGEDSVVKSVTAIGITAVSPELRKYNDRDNALGIVEFYDGRIAQLFCSRMMAAGQEDCNVLLLISLLTSTDGLDSHRNHRYCWQTRRQHPTCLEPGQHLRAQRHSTRDPPTLLWPFP